MGAKKLKVAIACDWLTNVGGAEKVLLKIHQMYPDAPIYTSKYDSKGIDWFKDADVRTGWLQIFPTKLRRLISPLRQAYFNHLDLSEYDVVISVTGAEAKSLKTGPNTTHFCYCHVPTQYYWQMYDDYVKHPGFNKILDPFISVFLRLLIKPLRKADYKGAQRPDYFITISSYAADMIKKYYHRDAVVISPGVEIEKFLNNKTGKRSGFINFSRQVSWKRQDLIVQACIKAGKPVTLIGDGPEHANLVSLAKHSDLVTFLPTTKTEDLKDIAASAEGFIFPSKEPFGIAPVEALAAGCPVIAFGEGGAKDFIHEGENGIFFKKQTVKSLCEALKVFESYSFNSKKVAKTSEAFSNAEFERKIYEFIDEKTAK